MRSRSSMNRSVSSSDHVTSGEIFRRPVASRLSAGAFARVGPSARRSPVTQPAYGVRWTASGSTLRMRQQAVGLFR